MIERGNGENNRHSLCLKIDMKMKQNKNVTLLALRPCFRGQLRSTEVPDAVSVDRQ